MKQKWRSDIEPPARRSRNRRSIPIIQTKLVVGPAGDRFEREADAVADRVVAAIRLPALGHNADDQSRIHRMSARGVRDEMVPNVAGRIQRMGGIGQAGGDVDRQTEREIASSEASGRPLPAVVRSTLEPAFGADFSSVRIHEGERSSELNDRIQAKAFTTGNHVFFRDGFPDMSQREGQHLLAHELAHTLQQGASSPRLQRATTIQRFLDPSQQAKLKKARADLTAMLNTPKGSGKAQATRKKKIDDLRAIVDSLENTDRTTPAPTVASTATLLPGDLGKDATGGGITTPQTQAVVPKVGGEQTSAPTTTADPLAAKRAALLSKLEAAEKARSVIRRTVTTALRARMPREYLETSSDIDRIVSQLPPQTTFDDYRSRIARFGPEGETQAEAAVATLVEAVSDANVQVLAGRYADWLDNLTVQQVTKLADAAIQGDDGKVPLRNYLLSALEKRLAVGPLRAYYQSSHDKEQLASYGMSFDLSNSPLSVHCHTAGSGTQITSLSIKSRDREGGAAVLSEKWLGPALADALAKGISRSAENPRSVVLDIKEGRRRQGRWNRPGIR